MKRQISQLLRCALLAAVVGIAASVGAARANTFLLSDSSVHAGGTLSIAVGDSTLDAMSLVPFGSIVSIDVEITFDPTQLTFHSASVGTLLPNAVIDITPNDSSSLIVSPSQDLTVGQVGGTFFSVLFDVSPTATGSTLITISTAYPDLSGEYLLPSSPPLSADIPITTVGVPLHHTSSEFLSGIALFALVFWFRRRAERRFLGSGSEARA
jgi:hypothetical protein